MKIKKLFGFVIILAVAVTGFAAVNLTAFKAKADDVIYSAGDLWDFKNSAEFDGVNSKLVLTYGKENSEAVFKNKLPLDGFNFKFSFGKDGDTEKTFEKFILNLKSPAPEGAEESSVINAVTFWYNGTDFKAELNKTDDSDGAVTLGGVPSGSIEITVDADYKLFVNTIELGTLKEVGKKYVELSLKNGAEQTVSVLNDVICNQVIRIGSNKAILTEGTAGDGTAVTDQDPVIVVHTAIDTNDYYVPAGMLFKFDFSAYDVLSGDSDTKLYIKKEADADEDYIERENKNVFVISVANEADGDAYIVKFEGEDKGGNKSEFTKKVLFKPDKSVPTISGGFDLADFEDKLSKAVFKDTSEGTIADWEYVYMGSGEYLKIPSIKGMFTDDVTVAAELKYELIYNTPSSQEKSLGSNLAETSLKIELTEEGKYQFKIRAIDQSGNKSEYTKLFEFEIKNTAGPQVTAPSTIDPGYLDSEYTFNSFTVKGIKTSYEYELFYQAVGSTTWIEAEEELNSLTFTPEKLGKYKLVCTVTDNSLLEKSAEAVVTVDEKKTIIKGPNYWARDNVLSIIFLCTGSLSLIGIILLLLIKPKQAEEGADLITEEPKAKKAKKEKKEKK